MYRLNPAMAMKHGFSSVAEYKANAQKKFSLLEAGILKKPATRLLLINVGCFLGFAEGLALLTFTGHSRRLDAHRGLDDAV